MKDCLKMTEIKFWKKEANQSETKGPIQPTN